MKKVMTRTCGLEGRNGVYTDHVNGQNHLYWMRKTLISSMKILAIDLGEGLPRQQSLNEYAEEGGHRRQLGAKGVLKTYSLTTK
jgi:hypothetical protein